MKKKLVLLICAGLLAVSSTFNVLADDSPVSEPIPSQGEVSESDPLGGPDGETETSGTEEPTESKVTGSSGGQTTDEPAFGGGTTTTESETISDTSSGTADTAPKTGESHALIYGFALAVFLGGTAVISRKRLEEAAKR